MLYSEGCRVDAIDTTTVIVFNGMNLLLEYLRWRVISNTLVT